MPSPSNDASLPPPTPGRPRVVVYAFAPTPYQLHYARRLTTELREAEFVFLYTDEAPDQAWKIEFPEGVHVAHLQTGCPRSEHAGLGDLPKFLRRGRVVIDWMKRIEARALVCWGHNDLGRLRLVRWCGRNKIPYFLAADSNSLLDTRSALRRFVKGRYMRAFLSRAAGVMVFGRRGAEYFARYGVPASRAFFVPFEPEYARLESVTEADVEAARRHFGLDPARRRLVYCGRLVGIKRVDLLIDAFARIAQERPEWDVVVIGDGPQREALMQRVPPELAGRFHWLGFIAELQRIGPIYRASDVLVLPSDVEPWGLVVNEALASGLAVVTSDIVGAAAHLVRTGDARTGANGREFGRGSLDGLATALLEITDPGRIDAFKANSAAVLGEYRRLADPVTGMRAAMATIGVLSGPAAADNHRGTESEPRPDQSSSGR